MKLGNNKRLEKTYIYIVLGKTLSQAPQGVKGEILPKYQSFSKYLQSEIPEFLIFCMKLDNNKSLQNTYVIFGKTLVQVAPRGSKGQILPKNQLFSKYICKANRSICLEADLGL